MTHTVLYVAATEEAAAAGASALGRTVADAMVEPAVSLEVIRARAPTATCVVFAETPTTAEGTHLLDVIGACDGTPVILFTDSSYGPTTARSTDGIAGYVRSDTPDAAAHLADEIEWIAAEQRGAPDLERVRHWPGSIGAAGTPAEVYDELCRLGAEIPRVDAVALYVSESGRIEPWQGIEDPATEPVVRGLASEAYTRGTTQRSSDVLDRPELEGTATVAFRSVICVPMGDVGVLALAAEEPGAFDDASLNAAVVLTRIAALGLAKAEFQSRATTDEGRLETLFEALPLAAVRFAVRDGNPVIEAVNRSFVEEFGHEEGDVVDVPLEEVLVPTGFDTGVGNIEAALEAGEPSTSTVRRQTTDNVREFDVTVIPSGAGRGVACYRDVTSREHRERKIVAQRDRLAEVGRLVDGLRDPLNLANAYTEAAERTGDPDHFAEVVDALEWMEEAIESLILLTRQLEVITETEPVALHDIARRAWTAIDDGRATLEFAEDTIVDADKVRLTEVLEICFGNAAEHATVDGTVTVRVGATADGFYVEDDGPGIPDHRRSAVFEPGYTTARDGTGYGLDLVERIAEAHGWEVSITEGRDGGARFLFSGVAVPDVSLPPEQED